MNHYPMPRSPVAVITALLLVTAFSLSAQTGVQSGIARVNGTELYYEMAGEGHPLVLIHGGAVDRRAWDLQFDEFARHYKTIRYDTRGLGKSGDRDVPFSNSQDLYELLKYLDIEQAHLAGISRGGGFAFDFTLEHPEMVTALVLVSSNMGVNVPAYHEMFERSTKVGRESGAAAAAAVWGYDPHQGPVREAARPRVLEIIEDNIARFRYLDGSEPVERLRSSDIPRTERLGEIPVPTLVISGVQDAPVARQNSRNWASGIPRARLVVFRDAAHLVNIDRPEAFNRTVLQFLGNIQPPGRQH